MIRRSAVVAAALASFGVLFVQPPTSAQEPVGEAVVVDARDTSQAIERGGSADIFTLRLPDDASCPGDSANDGYRVQTFIVPSDDDPATLTYESTKPVGDGRWALTKPDTRPVINEFTEMNAGAGEPGRIGGIPALTFGIYPPGLFVDGEYRIGVACTLYNETERVWATSIVLTNDSEDEPAELIWRLASASKEASERRGNGRLAVLLGAAGVCSAGVALLLRRSARRHPPSLLEHP